MKVTFKHAGGGHSQKTHGKRGGAGTKRVSRKITIQRAARLLDALGYKLGRARTDLKAKQTFYQVTDPNGAVAEMSTDAILALLDAP